MNTALLEFYWGLGADIVERQKTAEWGSGFLRQLSVDMMAEFPDMKGFSKRNLEQIRRWYLFYEKAVMGCGVISSTIAKQPATQLNKRGVDQFESQVVVHLVQIPWWHNVVIVSKCRDVTEALYYAMSK